MTIPNYATFASQKRVFNVIGAMIYTTSRVQCIMSNLRVRSEKLNFDADNMPIFGVYYISRFSQIMHTFCPKNVSLIIVGFIINLFVYHGGL